MLQKLFPREIAFSLFLKWDLALLENSWCTQEGLEKLPASVVKHPPADGDRE